MILTVVAGVGDGVGVDDNNDDNGDSVQCHPPGLHILISIVLINATRDQPATNGMRQRRNTNINTLLTLSRHPLELASLPPSSRCLTFSLNKMLSTSQQVVVHKPLQRVAGNYTTSTFDQFSKQQFGE